PDLIYTSIQIKIEGVTHTLSTSLQSSTSDTTLAFDTASGWNIGTIIKSGLERMRVEELMTSTTIRVQRNYSADGKISTISSHAVGAVFTAESTSVSLALPDPTDATYNTMGLFLDGGKPLATGVDPTVLTSPMTTSEASNVVKSSSALKYSVGALLQIGKEIMKIISISGNDIQVLRGYNGTARATHATNDIIYCVGIVDKAPITHKFFIKNDPPAGLPTQRKKDIKIVLVADEEPL
ncbi:MAG: hypothetical protein RR128_06345, partial [Clostridium sp.]